MISPATEGAKAVEPGTVLLTVLLLSVSGGHKQLASLLMDISSRGLMGFSLE